MMFTGPAVTNCLQNSGKMKGYPDDIWTVGIWTVKLPGDIWTVEIWTVKTGLGLPLGLGFLLGLRLDLGLGLVMTVHFMTVQILSVQINTGNHATVSSPHFLAHVYCRQTAGWINMPFGMDYGGTCRPRPHCVKWEPSSPIRGTAPLNFGRVLWPNGWMDQNATWYGGRPQRR